MDLEGGGANKNEISNWDWRTYKATIFIDKEARSKVRIHFHNN